MLAPPPTVVAVASYLASVATPERGCFPKQRTIADRVGIAVRSVNRAIAWLKQQGILQVEQRGRTSALYSTGVQKTAENHQLSLDFGADGVANGVAIPIKLTDLSNTQGTTSLETEGQERSARSNAEERRPSPKEALEAVPELEGILAVFPRRFNLTSEALAVLAKRLSRKAEFWKRPVADVVSHLQRKASAIAEQPWLRPWSPAWFTTDLEARFRLDAFDRRAKPPPESSPPAREELPMQQYTAMTPAEEAELARAMGLDLSPSPECVPKSAPSTAAAAPVEYPPDDGFFERFLAAIRETGRVKQMPEGRIV